MEYDYMDCAAKRVTEEGLPTCGAGVRSKHPLVTTLEQLDALDESEMIDGYLAAERGDPEPGTNHSLAYCCDWQAHFDGDEPNDDGQMLVSRGATEQEAIEDLLELIKNDAK